MDTLYTKTFNIIFPVLDEQIKDVHPDIEVRKIYAYLRTQGMSVHEAGSFIESEVLTMKYKKKEIINI